MAIRRSVAGFLPAGIVPAPREPVKAPQRASWASRRSSRVASTNRPGTSSAGSAAVVRFGSMNASTQRRPSCCWALVGSHRSRQGQFRAMPPRRRRSSPAWRGQALKNRAARRGGLHVGSCLQAPDDGREAEQRDSRISSGVDRPATSPAARSCVPAVDCRTVFHPTTFQPKAAGLTLTWPIFQRVAGRSVEEISAR